MAVVGQTICGESGPLHGIETLQRYQFFAVLLRVLAPLYHLWVQGREQRFVV
jgi:hypothetical protein